MLFAMFDTCPDNPLIHLNGYSLTYRLQVGEARIARSEYRAALIHVMAEREGATELVFPVPFCVAGAAQGAKFGISANQLTGNVRPRMGNPVINPLYMTVPIFCRSGIALSLRCHVVAVWLA